VDVPPAVLRVGRAFADAGAKVYLVGGTIRDALLGRAPGPDGDWDLTTDARPEQILAITAALAAATWETGIEFGTVGVQVDGLKLEITTHRADEYDGVSRNPLVRFGDSIVDDLRRRDFTMNAMALSLPDGEFIDPHGGLGDLARGVLRTPAPPQESFGDDPLRMLRAARFVSQLGVSMTAMAPALSRIAVERIQVELSKLLLGAHPREGLGVLVDTGLAAIVLPELPALAMAADEHGQHKDVYAHTLQVLDQAIALEHARGFAPDLTLRWAALLHDVGKPATRRFEDAGRVTFHHHEVVGARMAKARLKALRYSNDVIADVSQLVFLHLRFYGYGRGEWTDSAVRRYVTDAGALLDRLHVLVRSDTTTRNQRKAAALARTYDELEERIAALRAQEELDSIRPDLDGNEIMRILDIPPGRQVGQAYQHLLALRMEGGPMSNEAAVAALREWAAANIA
jgi:poly(A) polymerase